MTLPIYYSVYLVQNRDVGEAFFEYYNVSLEMKIPTDKTTVLQKKPIYKNVFVELTGFLTESQAKLELNNFSEKFKSCENEFFKKL
jgi:hypothetical protein